LIYLLVFLNGAATFCQLAIASTCAKLFPVLKSQVDWREFANLARCGSAI
jgi:hypothetical protein